MRMKIVGIVTGVLALGAIAATDAHKSTSRDEGALPKQYRVLLSRSVFAANGKAEAEANAVAPAPTPESLLALKGVVQDDQRFTAFVESLPQKRVIQLKVGDAIARGRIVAITLHELQYESAGRRTRVAIGQALSGAGPTTRPSLDADGPPVASTPQEVSHSPDLAEAQ